MIFKIDFDTKITNTYLGVTVYFPLVNTVSCFSILSTCSGRQKLAIVLVKKELRLSLTNFPRFSQVENGKRKIHTHVRSHT